MTFGTTGISQWIKDNLVTLLVLAAGVGALIASRKGDIPRIITIIAGVLMAGCIIAMATGTTFTDIGTYVVNLFKS